jgi:hypothetical protein
MSKKISFRGSIPDTNTERIKLATIKGKIGYKIVKFQIIAADVLGAQADMQAQITKTSDGASATVDFSNADLLAVATYKTEPNASQTAQGTTIIFDNEMFNQDIFITGIDGGTGNQNINYYIELEAREISDLESTMLTLKNLRTITS